MRLRQMLLLQAVVILAFASTGCKTVTEAPIDVVRPEEQIETLFTDYWDEMADSDADDAFDQLSINSVAWLERLAIAVSSFNADQVKALPLTELENVLLTRHVVCPGSFGEISAQHMYRIALDNGLLLPLVYDSHDPDVGELHSVSVHGDTASATIAGRPSLSMWHFTREANGWKIDLEASFAHLDEISIAAAQDRGESPVNKAKDSVIGLLLDQQFDERAWDGFVPCD